MWDAIKQKSKTSAWMRRRAKSERHLEIGNKVNLNKGNKCFWSGNEQGEFCHEMND